MLSIEHLYDVNNPEREIKGLTIIPDNKTQVSKEEEWSAGWLYVKTLEESESIKVEYKYIGGVYRSDEISAKSYRSIQRVLLTNPDKELDITYNLEEGKKAELIIKGSVKESIEFLKRVDCIRTVQELEEGETTPKQYGRDAHILILKNKKEKARDRKAQIKLKMLGVDLEEVRQGISSKPFGLWTKKEGKISLCDGVTEINESYFRSYISSEGKYLSSSEVIYLLSQDYLRSEENPEGIWKGISYPSSLNLTSTKAFAKSVYALTRRGTVCKEGDLSISKDFELEIKGSVFIGKQSLICLSNLKNVSRQSRIKIKGVVQISTSLEKYKVEGKENTYEVPGLLSSFELETEKGKIKLKEK